GQPLPTITLKTVAGAAASVRQYLKPGRRALINVWATWCVPCAKEMPELERLRASLAANSVDLIGLNVDAEPDADVKGFLKIHRVSYPIYVGGVPAIEQLYATDELSVPLSVVVNDKGIVTEIIPGWSEKTQKRFAALAGK
ncbi:MAG: TlpA family protein disulfide reductase, partial [Acidobacteriota bacterium]|nr:TlpA family protein disulfide reductase [Acidobacteriota bacterium]